jgi:predicted amidohydrolase
VRVGYFQCRPRFGEPDQNLQMLCDAVSRAEAELLVLPELATSGYLFTRREEVEELAQPLPGPATAELQEACQRSGCRVVVGLAERADNRLYNSAALVGPAGVEGVYRKAHLFGDEKLYFTPGSDFPLFTVAGVRVGILVCFDHMFPEAARTLALRGAQVICHPSNLVLPEYGQLTTRARAIENRLYWVLANRYGSESRGGKTLRYTGASQIVGADGALLARAPAQADELAVVEIDPAVALDKRVTQRNDLFADRRLELYELG